jgi:hypothetical protein
VKRNLETEQTIAPHCAALHAGYLLAGAELKNKPSFENGWIPAFAGMTTRSLAA